MPSWAVGTVLAPPPAAMPIHPSSPSSCLSRPLLGVLLAGAFVLTATASREAEACGAPQPALYSTTPAEGATYPGNAALLFSGVDLTLDAVTVTVDGQPAQLTEAPFAAGWANIAVLVEPAPQAGQTVVVSGSFCDPAFCEPTMLTYTAGAPDLTAPVPVVDAAFFAVFDHADFVSSGGDCQSDTDLTLYVHVTQDEPAAGQALGVVRAAWSGGGGGFGDFTFASGSSATMSIPLVVEQLGGKDPASEVCVTVTATDTAGNAAAPFEVCPACYFRKDDGPVDGAYVPEPEWTDADAVPGSACAGAEATTGDTGPEPTTGATGEVQTTGDVQTTGVGETSDPDDGGDKGCACDHTGGPRDIGGLVVMALGLGLARRRRS
jgi:MYXO-CTERM domain-containing protein